jgi:hypothetical protein
MNYAEELKKKELLVANLKATAIAKQKSIEELLSKKKELEKECMKKHSISLSEVSGQITNIKSEIDDLFNQITDEVSEIEQSIKSIKG